MDLTLYLVIGLIIHFIILYIITQKEFLRWPDGIIIAALVSIIIYLTNFIYWIILFAFFIPSSLLTKANLERKKNKIISEKTGYRNGLQVISNSFGLFIFALIQLLISGIDGQLILAYLVAGTIFIASASADTWSTEIGTLNKSDPHYILNLKKKVPKGTSGGVSLIGSFGGFLGALLISVILNLLLFLTGILHNLLNFILLISLVTIMGFSGQVLDSLLGALLQNKYFCPVCNLQVEESFHQSCKTNDLKKVNKYTFLNNNTVNLTSNMLMSILGLFLIIYFKPI